MSLIDKIQKARQTNVEAGGFTFTITRPTPMQTMEWLNGLDGDPLSYDDINKFIKERFSLHDKTWRNLAQEAIERFVVGWTDIKELDIIPGGDGSLVPFDRDVFLVWVQDRPEIIATLGFQVFQSWINYLEAQKEAEKKPETGISPDS